MPVKANRASSEPIPGYEILERIGAGGYGEVWKATAPGGLDKAVKFVYGYHDEERAARESKALNRIKEVRHPFLLSLERFEVVDGQLVIVTELADGCLKTRFEKCRDEGEVGIPRKELVGYMRDAADALDFMSEQHSLQHLDIKPENLLIVGGHIKVADFGLVKDIHDATASLMGGLTPLYAPPEVYEGKPSQRSDQYSLAIVYLEMLTGELPFPGKTAAQLASQHLHAKPRLSALSDSDRKAIARALQKKPADRFLSCGDLVEAIASENTSVAPQFEPSQPSGQSVSATSPLTSSGAEQSAIQTDNTPVSTDPYRKQSRVHAPLPEVNENPEVRTVPPLPLSSVKLQLSPTLFVGIGGAGTRVLTQLAHRMQDRFGALTTVPAIQFLLLDSDPSDLTRVANSRTGLAFPARQLLSLPLKRPQDYRDGSVGILRWLSRRWLYNIPKSLRTEGLRPLGRLSWVDNAARIEPRLRDLLSMATSEDAVAMSSEATQLAFDGSPQVYLVGSSSGGTSSGSMIDLAYQIRQAADELGANISLTGVATHATNRIPASKELSAVNTFAFLSELSHFQNQSFPGCPAGQLRPSNSSPFDLTFLQHLGDDLSDQQYRAQTDGVAEQLYAMTVTNAKNLFDEIRKTADESLDQNDMLLRSLNLHRMSAKDEVILTDSAKRLCQLVVEQWQGSSIGQTAEIDSQARDLCISLELECDKLVEAEVGHAEHGLGQPLEQFLESHFDEYCQSHPFENAGELSRYFSSLEGLFGSLRDEETAQLETPVVLDRMSRGVKRAFQEKSERIRFWLLDLLEDESVRVAGAEHAAEVILEFLREQEMRLAELSAVANQEMTAVEATVGALDELTGKRRRLAAKNVGGIEGLVSKLHSLAIRVFVLGHAQRFLHSVKGLTTDVNSEQSDFRRELRVLHRGFEPTMPDDDEEGETLLRRLAAAIEERLPALVDPVVERCDETLLKPHKGLRIVVSTGGRIRNELPDRMLLVARNLLLATLKDIDITAMLFSEQGEVNGHLSAIIDATEPELLKAGGDRRILALVPSQNAATQISKALAEDLKLSAQVMPHVDGDFAVAQAAERVAASQVAVRIIDSRQDYADFAGRLHSRMDVNWREFGEA